MKMKRRIRTINIVFYEGFAEQNLFNYLKDKLDSQKRFNPKNCKGINTLKEFKREEKSYFSGVSDIIDKKIILFDSDLKTSKSIREYCKNEGYTVIAFQPKIEQFLLDIYKSKATKKLDAKEAFESTFNKEASKMKTQDYDKIFGKNGCNIKDLAKDFELLKKIIDLF
jgi:hypothetical protein